MPGYVQASLLKFQHPEPQHRQDAPHTWRRPIYGASVQYADPADTSPPLSPQTINRIQQVVGTLLYYSIAVDPNMLVAVGAIATNQAKGTQKTHEATVWLLNYAASHPHATIRYRASGMVLHIHSDASYLSEPCSRSRAGGHFFLAAHPSIR